MKISQMRGLLIAAAATFAISHAVAQDAKPKAPAPAPDTVVATVNGMEILYEELENAHRQLPPQYQKMPLETLYEPLLSQIVDRRMLATIAEKEGFDKTEDVVKRLAVARRNILAESWLAEQVEPAVSEEKLMARYEADKKNIKGEEEIHASHILLENEADARKVLAEIRNGADFAEMAKQHSKKNGGDLGFFDAKTMVPEFSKAAFAMKVGDVSEPVKTQFGWHIIRIEAKRQSEGPSFEQRKQEIRQALAQEAVANTLEELRGKADIKMFNPDGTPLVPIIAAPEGDKADEKKPAKSE
jgi:peptidyl-prolyl cis-trans isomerase C